METVAIHADRGSERIITRIPAWRFGPLAEMLGSDGIWGAYRREDGAVVVVDRTGEAHLADITVSPDGYVFA